MKMNWIAAAEKKVATKQLFVDCSDDTNHKGIQSPAEWYKSATVQKNSLNLRSPVFKNKEVLQAVQVQNNHINPQDDQLMEDENTDVDVCIVFDEVDGEFGQLEEEHEDEVECEFDDIVDNLFDEEGNMHFMNLDCIESNQFDPEEPSAIDDTDQHEQQPAVKELPIKHKQLIAQHIFETKYEKDDGGFENCPDTIMEVREYRRVRFRRYVLTKRRQLLIVKKTTAELEAEAKALPTHSSSPASKTKRAFPTQESTDSKYLIRKTDGPFILCEMGTCLPQIVSKRIKQESLSKPSNSVVASLTTTKLMTETGAVNVVNKPPLYFL